MQSSNLPSTPRMSCGKQLGSEVWGDESNVHILSIHGLELHGCTTCSWQIHNQFLSSRVLVSFSCADSAGGVPR